MYLEHFGLDRPPFSITPDTSLFYEGCHRGAALDALTFAIKTGEGIIKVVGEVGSGKTMLCRMLEVKLSKDVDIVYIANPSLSPDNILHVIAHELELDVSEDSSKFGVMQKLQEYLLEKHSNNRQVVMFIEEAQSMPVETLEEIRLLSNLETDQNKLLQMVLFGQPELDEKLSQSHIRQLKERITHSFYLEPFPPEDIFDYLNFRMRAVGYGGPDIFNKKTARSIKKYSGGLTRRINILADKSLMAAFSQGKHEVGVSHVKIAAKDSDFDKISAGPKWFKRLLFVGGLMVAVWIGTLLPDLSFLVQGLNKAESVEVISRSNKNKSASDSDINEISTVSSERLPQDTQPDSLTDKTEIKAAGANVPLNDDGVAPVGGNSTKQQSEAAKTESRLQGQHSSESGREDQVTTAISALDDTAQVENDLVESGESVKFDSLLENRLIYTKRWIHEKKEKKYSIQLFLSSKGEEATLESYLRNAPESLDFNKIYIYETRINNKYLYSVVYDDFVSFKKAVSVAGNLTDSLDLGSLFVRRISDIRAAIDSNSVDK